MIPNPEQLVTATLGLNRGDRASLAALLIESLDEPFDDPELVQQAWRDEVKRRTDELDSGKVKAIPWDEAWPQIVRAMRGADEFAPA